MRDTIAGIGRRTMLAGTAALLGLASHSHAQGSFPSKPIRVLIGVPAGGTQDVLTRAIADVVRDTLGPIVLDNRGGAAGRIAVDVVKNAEPDGHTLLLGTAGMMTMFPNAYKNLSYDPLKDFAPIINAASFELGMMVHKDVPANTVAEFVAWAKTQGPQGGSPPTRYGSPNPTVTPCCSGRPG